MEAESNSLTDRIVDEYLILRCQDGDAAALTSLVVKWQRPFQRFASVVTKDRDLAADIVQDSWIKIIKGLPHLRDPVSFQAWAYRIVNNQCMDAMRKHRRNEDGKSDLSMMASSIKLLEERDHVATLLGRLSEKHRSVLALHYLLGFEVGEIATILKRPKGTVKSRLFNAREKFRLLLEDGDEKRPGETYEPARPTNSGSLAGSF